MLIALVWMWLLVHYAHGQTVVWEYPAEAPAFPPVTFNVYVTTNLAEPFELLTQVEHIAFVESYSTAQGAGHGAAFFKVSASNAVDEVFAVRIPRVRIPERMKP